MLAPLEIGCLRWVSQGKTLADIALLEGIAVTEVQAHLERALPALDAKSIEEALRKVALLRPD